MSKDKTNQKGITLIALVITIIVMLILVGVSVTVALNGGLFSSAKQAAEGTATKRNEELALSDGRIKIGDKWYDSLEDYERGEESANQGDTAGNGGQEGTTYAIGTEVTIGETGENFYVIKDDGAELVLLAKYNLKADGEDWIQDTSGKSNPYAFSAAGGFTTGEDLNNNSTVKADTTSAVYTAMKYAENTIGNGATGRLMTFREAQPLSESEDEEILEILYGTYSAGAHLNYWLGSAYNASSVWDVYGSVSSLGSGDFGNYSTFGVRPVIVISESSVTLVP